MATAHLISPRNHNQGQHVQLHDNVPNVIGHIDACLLQLPLEVFLPYFNI